MDCVCYLYKPNMYIMGSSITFVILIYLGSWISCILYYTIFLDIIDKILIYQIFNYYLFSYTFYIWNFSCGDGSLGYHPDEGGSYDCQNMRIRLFKKCQVRIVFIILNLFNLLLCQYSKSNSNYHVDILNNILVLFSIWFVLNV